MEKTTFDRWLLGGGGLVAPVGARRHRDLSKHAAPGGGYELGRHTHEVIAGLEAVVSAMTDAETGHARLSAHRRLKLLPYAAAVASINGLVDRVERLTVDNPAQQTRFPELRSIAARLEVAEVSIACEEREISMLRGSLSWPVKGLPPWRACGASWVK